MSAPTVPTLTALRQGGGAPPAPHRWSFCYLDGDAERLAGFDLFAADVPCPPPGVHLVELVIANPEGSAGAGGVEVTGRFERRGGDPLDVACPFCSAQRGRGCSSRGAGVPCDPHPARQESSNENSGVVLVLDALAVIRRGARGLGIEGLVVLLTDRAAVRRAMTVSDWGGDS